MSIAYADMRDFNVYLLSNRVFFYYCFICRIRFTIFNKNGASELFTNTTTDAIFIFLQAFLSALELDYFLRL